MSDYPVDTLPGVAQTFVVETAASLSCAVDHVAGAVLGVLAHGVGAGRRVEIRDGWTEGARLFIALVGPTGDSKTPAMTKALAPVFETQGTIFEAHQQASLDHHQALKDWKAHDKNTRDDPPEPPDPPRRLHTSDITIEKLAQLLGQNPRGLLVHHDELASWVRQMNAYRGGRGGDRQHWLSIWAGAMLTVDRVTTEPVYVPNPYATVIGGIQPDILPELTSAQGEDGFVDRILLHYPQPHPWRWTDQTVRDIVRREYAALYRQLLRLPDETITIHPQARKEFATWADSLMAKVEQMPEGTIKGSTAKLRSYVPRLALIINDTNQDEQVSRDTMLAAITLADYYQHTIQKAVGHYTSPLLNARSGGRNHRTATRAILARLQRTGTPTTARELLRNNTGGIVTMTDMRHVLEDLEATGQIFLEETTVTGGTRITVRLATNT